MTVRIVTDRTCDLPSEVIAECRIAVVPIRMYSEVASIRRLPHRARRRRPGVHTGFPTRLKEN
jgi:fatty acid-binding protein DegV